MTITAIDRMYKILQSSGPWSKLGKVAFMLIEQERYINNDKAKN